MLWLMETVMVGNFLMAIMWLLFLRGRRMRLVKFHGVAPSTLSQLVGGILGGRTWLFSTVMWSMGVFGIGRCLCLLFGIVGIIGIVGRWSPCNVMMLTIGRLFTVMMKRMNFYRWCLGIFERRLSFRLVSTVEIGFSAVFCCGIVSILPMDWGGFAGLRNGKGERTN